MTRNAGPGDGRHGPEHDGHDGHGDHSGHVEMFRRRFWWSLLITVQLVVFSQSLWRVRHRGEDEMMGGWPLGCGRRSFLEPRARSQSGARPEGPGSVASSTNPRF